QVANAAAGQVVFRQGDAPGALRVVVSGRVELRRDGAAIAELGPGELLGEVALLGGAPQPYEAVAMVSTTLLVLPAEAVGPLLTGAGAFPLGLAQTLADRATQLGGASAARPTAARTPPPASGPSTDAAGPPDGEPGSN